MYMLYADICATHQRCRAGFPSVATRCFGLRAPPLSKANAVLQSMLCTTLDWRPLSRLVCTYANCQGDTGMLRSAARGDCTVAPV